MDRIAPVRRDTRIPLPKPGGIGRTHLLRPGTPEQQGAAIKGQREWRSDGRVAVHGRSISTKGRAGIIREVSNVMDEPYTKGER